MHNIRNKAFTLVELLIVISIVSVLATYTAMFANDMRKTHRSYQLRLQDNLNAKQAINQLRYDIGAASSFTINETRKKISITRFSPEGQIIKIEYKILNGQLDRSISKNGEDETIKTLVQNIENLKWETLPQGCHLTMETEIQDHLTTVQHQYDAWFAPVTPSE